MNIHTKGEKNSGFFQFNLKLDNFPLFKVKIKNETMIL